MKICKLSTYAPGAGDILVLEDCGPEGIMILSQHKRIEDVVAALARSYSDRVAVVRLVDLDVTEIQTELPLPSPLEKPL